MTPDMMNFRDIVEKALAAVIQEAYVQGILICKEISLPEWRRAERPGVSNPVRAAQSDQTPPSPHQNACARLHHGTTHRDRGTTSPAQRVYDQG